MQALGALSSFWLSCSVPRVRTECVAFRGIKFPDMVLDFIQKAYLIEEPDRVGEIFFQCRMKSSPYVRQAPMRSMRDSFRSSDW